MSQFSELLRRYIKNNNISIRKIALAVGMDRTLLQKYLSGDRIPKNQKEIEKIGNLLVLSPYQQAQLIELYYREIYGNKSYENFFIIKEFLEGAHNFAVAAQPEEHQLSSNALFSAEKIEIERVVSGKIQLQTAVIQLLESLGRNRKGSICIKMLIQPEENAFFHTLLLASNKIKVDIEHIICLDMNRNDNANFRAIFSLLPFEVNDITYQARYYYDHPESHLNHMSLFPYMLLIDDYAFLGNKNTDEWLVLRQSEEVNLCRKQYETIRKFTKPLELPIKHTSGMLDNSAVMLDADEAVEIGYFPCITVTFDEYLLEKYFMTDEMEKEAVMAMVETLTARIKEKMHWRNYFSEKGLRAFMETGKIPIYPEMVYKRPEMADRILILERMITLVRAGKYSAYISNEVSFHMTSGISIEYSGNGNVCIRWSRKDNFAKTIRIQEPSIGDSVMGFERFAVENGWFYNEEETVKRMEELLEEYVKQV